MSKDIELAIIVYMTVYLVISLPKIPYIHRIYMVLANPTVYIRYFWQGNQEMYGHIRCIYKVLANPTNMLRSGTSLRVRSGAQDTSLRVRSGARIIESAFRGSRHSGAQDTSLRVRSRAQAKDTICLHVNSVRCCVQTC